MDIDPIDDGPKESKQPHPMTTYATGAAAPLHISEEEEARQAIDMLRGDDVSARVAAANRLEAVASALGQERTREVCLLRVLLLRILRAVSVVCLILELSIAACCRNCCRS
jgi:hypothetical protein